MPAREETTRMVREILRDQCRLAVDVDGLEPDSSLAQAGLTSHASVNLMLGLESAFDIEFPDSLLKRSTFESIASITAAVESLQEELAA